MPPGEVASTRKVVVVGLALVVTTAAVVLLGRSVHAQAGRSIVDLPALLSGGSRLGVSVRDVRTDDLAGAGLDEPRGVLVEAVTPNSPADRVGFQEGDVVLEFDGVGVRSVRQFIRLVQDTPPGRSVAATVMRGGRRQPIVVVLEASPRSVNVDLPEIRRDIEAQLRDLPRALDDLDFDLRRMLVIPRPPGGRAHAVKRPVGVVLRCVLWRAGLRGGRQFGGGRRRHPRR